MSLLKKSSFSNLNSASYLDLYLEHDINGTLTTKLYYKRDDFIFPWSLPSFDTPLSCLSDHHG